MKVSRNISSSERQSFDCNAHEASHENLIFYFYDKENFATGYELGIDADSIDLIGEFEANACLVFSSIKMYAYPGE